MPYSLPMRSRNVGYISKTELRGCSISHATARQLASVQSSTVLFSGWGWVCERGSNQYPFYRTLGERDLSSGPGLSSSWFEYETLRTVGRPMGLQADLFEVPAFTAVSDEHFSPKKAMASPGTKRRT